MNNSPKNASTWEEVSLPRFGKLNSSGRFDVVVIGGGITGLTAAYLLKRAGKKVCVLERDRVGGVDTRHTTAHLTQVTDRRLSKLVKNFGKDEARLAWLGGAAAINTIEEIIAALGINCQFTRVPGYLHASLDGTKDESVDLQHETELANELGFDAAFMQAVPLVGKPGVRFPNQAKFHPLLYIASLARAIDGEGSAVFEESDVSEVKEEPTAAVVGRHKIECDYMVIATHVPLMGKTGLISATLFQTKLAPYTSYVVGATMPRGTMPEASFWDTSDPYYYLRIDSQGESDYAIFGGNDHKTGQETQPDACFGELAARLHDLIPEAKIDHQWSGQVVETHDGLPYMGETAERQFVATGFSGNGMTFGTLGAMMACDAALGRTNPWQDLFSVSRKKIRAGAWDYIKENFDYAYYLVRDRLAPAEGDSLQDVKPGEGKILKLDGQRVACYRDDEGKVSTVSAVCTHMGCLVRWNRAEKTWDCPCHGSRFHATGEVMAGPAETSLEPVSERKQRKAPPLSAQKKKPVRQRSAAPDKDRQLASRRSRRK
jgi:glycine/D-amino acid oxidase-like deaminating enzyme/nitrite reductase/ring-hydroxylating ferredoxin subunit